MSKRTRSIIELWLNIPALICLLVSIICVTIQLAGGSLNSMWSTIPLGIATTLICADGIFDIIYVKIGKDN